LRADLFGVRFVPRVQLYWPGLKLATASPVYLYPHG
jgi:hypothetical protein